jgi:hypothetical protein
MNLACLFFLLEHSWNLFKSYYETYHACVLFYLIIRLNKNTYSDRANILVLNHINKVSFLNI